MSAAGLPTVDKPTLVLRRFPVSLQGSLDTFALPDVLVLLASTKKSGELHVAGTRTVGSARATDLQGLIWVDDGQLVGFDVARSAEAAEAVFELLRLRAGSVLVLGRDV